MRITPEDRHHALLHLNSKINTEYNGRIIYLTISGADLYGFASVDSDIDYRGCFLTGTENIIGLFHKRDHYTEIGEIDYVLYELSKELGLLLRGNCNVLEHIYSNPFHTTTDYWELKKIADLSLHANGPYNSYKGLARENYHKFLKRKEEQSYKKWLHILRALKAGIYYLERKRVAPDVLKVPSSYTTLDYLVDCKITGLENDLVDLASLKEDLDQIYLDLHQQIDEAYANTDLPKECPEEAKEKAHRWLIKKRIEKIGR